MTGPVAEVHDAFCLHPLPDGGAVAALRGLSLEVAAGERLVVHGPNGSGKTTLMRALAGEQRLAAGRITVAGLELSGAGAGELSAWRSRSLGQIDQNAGLLLRPEFTVLANVSLQMRISGISSRQARAKATAALERLGLAELAGRRPGTLSGGQVQRVAVCAALAHDPAVVLADEPTGELDAASAEQVYELLSTAVRLAGATLVMVTHDRRAQAWADRVVRIRDGRISETWRPEQSSAGAAESLVVDDRGWVRLPLPLRTGLGLGSELVAETADGAVVLRPPAGPPISVTGHEPAAEAGLGSRELTRMASGEPVARLASIKVSYGGQAVLGGSGPGLDLEVRAGELVVIAGRSGAGKSTLLRVLLGLQPPDAGEVWLGGTDLRRCTRPQAAQVRARCSAVVMQQVYLAGTADAASNVDLARAVRGLPADPGLVHDQLAAVGLAGEAFEPTSGAGRPVSGLSGGERQRLAVARALAVRPALLVLDEPTSQLDEASAEQLAAVLVSSARAGTAIVLASHDPVLVAAADRVIELA